MTRLRLVVSLLLLALGLALSTGCASTGGRRSLQVAVVTASAVDLHSTRVALAAGALEANALMGQSLAQQAAVKLGTTAGTVWLTERLSREHPVLASVLLSAVTIAYSVIAGHNYKMSGQVTR